MVAGALLGILGGLGSPAIITLAVIAGLIALAFLGVALLTPVSIAGFAIIGTMLFLLQTKVLKDKNIAFGLLGIAFGGTLIVLNEWFMRNPIILVALLVVSVVTFLLYSRRLKIKKGFIKPVLAIGAIIIGAYLIIVFALPLVAGDSDLPAIVNPLAYETVLINVGLTNEVFKDVEIGAVSQTYIGDSCSGINFPSFSIGTKDTVEVKVLEGANSLGSKRLTLGETESGIARIETCLRTDRVHLLNVVVEEDGIIKDSSSITVDLR